MSTSEFELLNPPTDSISHLHYANTLTEPLLSVTSWDGTARIYDTVNNTNLHIIQHETPVLTSCFHSDSNHLLTSTIDNSLFHYDLTTHQFNTIITQQSPVKSIEYSDLTS